MLMSIKLEFTAQTNNPDQFSFTPSCAFLKRE